MIIESSVTGGNLSLIQVGVGTCWAINGRDKMILLEDIGERGYRVDRMLEHLSQANIFQNAAAILARPETYWMAAAVRSAHGTRQFINLKKLKTN